MKLVALIILTRSFKGFVNETIIMKFIHHGMEKADITTISTICLPISLILIISSQKFISKGKYLKYYHLIYIISGLLCFWRFIILQDFMATGNKSRAYWLLVLNGILDTVCVLDFVFLFAFLNLIVDERIGATMITIFTSIMNSSATLPRTIGLKLTDHMNYNVLAGFGFTGFAIALFTSFFIAKQLDATDPSA